MIRYRARWVMPVASPPVADGVVACEDGVIVYVGGIEDAPPGDDFDLGDSALLPGLVNAHTHLELTAMRGFLEDLPFDRWIDTLRRSRMAVLNDEAMLDSARLGVIEGIEHGITTFADTCSSGVAARALRECGARGIVYQETFGPDPKVCDTAMSELRARVAALRAEETGLVRIGISPHAPYTVSDDLYRAAAAYAREESLPMAMHIAEGADEHLLVTEGTGYFAGRLNARGIETVRRSRSPIQLLAELGAINPGALLIHAVNSEAEDIRTIVRYSGTVAHCPVSNAKFGHGTAPLLDFLEAGVPVGLGSDSVASNNRMDLLDEARIAVLFANSGSRSPTALSATRALELATLGGANALGLGAVIGSLEPGKSADLCAFRLDSARATPAEDPAATLVFALSGKPAFLTVVAGRHLVERGDLVLSVGDLRHRVARAGHALAAWRAQDWADLSRLPGSPTTSATV